MRARTSIVLLAAIAAIAPEGCVDQGDAGICVTTHQSLPDQRYESASIDACDEYCGTVGGYVCCYFEPDVGPAVAVAGDC